MRPIDADALAIEMRKGAIAIDDAYNLGIMAHLDKALRMVEEAPTINPEILRPRGEWKKGQKQKAYFDNELNSWDDYPEICTNCGYDATEYGAGVGNYCPNCGAKMENET